MKSDRDISNLKEKAIHRKCLKKKQYKILSENLYKSQESEKFNILRRQQKTTMHQWENIYKVQDSELLNKPRKLQKNICLRHFIFRAVCISPPTDLIFLSRGCEVTDHARAGSAAEVPKAPVRSGHARGTGVIQMACPPFIVSYKRREI